VAKTARLENSAVCKCA